MSQQVDLMLRSAQGKFLKMDSVTMGSFAKDQHGPRNQAVLRTALRLWLSSVGNPEFSILMPSVPLQGSFVLKPPDHRVGRG